MRCSQVVTAESPRKESARRKAAMNASCTASAAISGSRVVRKATAHIRSRWRRKSSPKASGSPAQCAESSSRSGSSRRSSRRDMSVHSVECDLRERDAELAAVLDQRGEPDDDVLRFWHGAGGLEFGPPARGAGCADHGGTLKALICRGVDRGVGGSAAKVEGDLMD